MLVTVPSAPFATHKRPPPKASATGSFPTSSRSVTSRLCGSTRTTEFEPVSVTHTEPSPIAIAAGDVPIGTGADGARLAPSIRWSVPSTVLATHAAPRP